MKKFEGYKCLVTGATSGIGLGITQELLGEGAIVVGIGRNFEQTKSLGDKFIPFTCDVYDPEQIKAACAFAGEKFGGTLDVLINNAGRGYYAKIDTVEPEEFDEGFHLLLRAPILFTRYCCEMMKSSKNPNIVNISSVSGMFLYSGEFLYTLAKTALIKFTMMTQKELTYLRCNCISPGIIDTPIFQYATEEVRNNFDFDTVAASLPAKRIGKPADIAKLVSFIISEDGSYLCGANIVSDGGFIVLCT